MRNQSYHSAPTRAQVAAEFDRPHGVPSFTGPSWVEYATIAACVGMLAIVSVVVR